ncbi:MAG: nicotinate-nucleotide--dimethylbenzimidazole phosphoribosyltransferase [Robiginitomaculum sp.]
MNTPTASPFTDIRALISGMPESDTESVAELATLLQSTAHLHPIGQCDAPALWLAGWQGRSQIAIERPLAAIFIASHGVAQSVRGIDPIIGAQERTELMTKGPAGVRAMAGSYGAAFKVFELGIEYPSADMQIAPSLSERDCAAAIAFGMEVVAEGADILMLGSAGFGAVSAAAAITLALYGGEAEYWASGQGPYASARVEAISAAVKHHAGQLGDPLEVLRRFGGRDIAGMVGAILAARHQRIPVLLDGFVTCAAAAILHEIDPSALHHCTAAHLSSEPAHGALLDRIGKTPLLDMGIGVGDGTGAILAMGVLKAAASAVGIMETAL